MIARLLAVLIAILSPASSDAIASAQNDNAPGYTFSNATPFDPATLISSENYGARTFGLRLPSGATYVRDGLIGKQGLAARECTSLPGNLLPSSSVCVPLNEFLERKDLCTARCLYGFERSCVEITNAGSQDLFLPVQSAEEWTVLVRGTQDDLKIQNCSRRFSAWEDPSQQNPDLEAWFNEQPCGTVLTQDACTLVNRACHTGTATITLSRRCLNALGVELDPTACLDDALLPEDDRSRGAQQTVICPLAAMAPKDTACCTPEEKKRVIPCAAPLTGLIVETVTRACPSGAVSAREIANFCQLGEDNTAAVLSAALLVDHTSPAVVASRVPTVLPTPMPSRRYKNLPSRKFLRSCAFNSLTIASGQSVTAFQAASVASGLACVSQDRTCTNGTLSGTYGFASCSVLPATTSQTELSIAALPRPATALLDYLIQDVCVDANDKPVSGDPATCPHHRDLKFGEFLPYIRYATAFGAAVTSFSSSPAEGSNAELLVLRPDQWSSNAFPGVASFRDTVTFDSAAGRSGFDIIDPNGPMISIIATANNEAPFVGYWAPGCDRRGAWTLFPSTAVAGATGTHVTATGIGDTCPSTFAWTGLNVWHFYQDNEPTLYTSGKLLPSIIEWSLDDHDPLQSGHFEQLYFTREYGVTRWENWQTPAYCAAHRPAGTNAHYCEPDNGAPNYTCNGANELTDFLGQHYVRISCWDQSHIVAASPGYNPLVSPSGGPLIFSRNRLTAGDFAAGLTTGWDFGPALTHVVKANADQNHYLSIVAPAGSAPAQRSLSQVIDVAAFNNARRLNWGLIGAASQPSTLMLTLRFMDAAGATLKAATKTFAVGASFKHMDDSITWTQAQTPATRLRIDIEPGASSVVYDLDEIYLTPTLQ